MRLQRIGKRFKFVLLPLRVDRAERLEERIQPRRHESVAERTPADRFAFVSTVHRVHNWRERVAQGAELVHRQFGAQPRAIVQSGQEFDGVARSFRQQLVEHDVSNLPTLLVVGPARGDARDPKRYRRRLTEPVCNGDLGRVAARLSGSHVDRQAGQRVSPQDDVDMLRTTLTCALDGRDPRNAPIRQPELGQCHLR